MKTLALCLHFQASLCPWFASALKFTSGKAVVSSKLSNSTIIGWFSEAGLHKWMPFVIFHARSRERSRATSLPGRFLSRCCFTLCITMEVELELRSSTNATTVAVAKITGERGWRVGKKMSLCRFSADQKIRNLWKKCVLGHPIAWATSYCLLPDTFWLQTFKNAFKVGTVNCKFIVNAFHCEESMHWK